MPAAEPVQHLRIRRPSGLGLFARGQRQLLKQDHAELLGRQDIEFPSRLLVDPLPQIRDLRFQHLTEFPHALLIDAHAGMLHIREHLNQRQLDLPQQHFHALLRDQLLQPFRECRQCRGVRIIPELLMIGQRLPGTEFFNSILRRRGIEQICTNDGIQHQIPQRIALLHQFPVDRLGVKGALRCATFQKAHDLRRIGQAGDLVILRQIQHRLLIQKIDRRLCIAELLQQIRIGLHDLCRTDLRLFVLRRSRNRSRRLHMQALHQLIQLQLCQQRGKLLRILRLFIIFRK